MTEAPKSPKKALSEEVRMRMKSVTKQGTGGVFLEESARQATEVKQSYTRPA